MQMTCVPGKYNLEEKEMAEVKKFGNPKSTAEETVMIDKEEVNEATPEEVNTEAPVIRKVTGCGALNIRSEALANSEILGTVLVDTNVNVDSEDGVWSKIEHGAIKGFCMSQYLKDL